AGLPVDNFSVRWVGSFQFAGGNVTFTARADDGIRVFLDGVAVIDQFHDQPATTYTATVNVAAGTHEVKVEYYERGGDAVAQVSWTGATAPGPTVTTLTPNTATAGGAAFTLTVDGANFVSGASVLWIEGAAAGSKTYTLSVGGTTITSTPTTSNGPVSLAWPTSTADNGARTATVTVRDSANATGRASITLNVAN